MLKRHLSLIVFILVLAGLALAQATLGNMVKLGTTTTAARPASSTTIQGALLYDTDVAAPIYNTGSTWSTLGVSSSPLWVDAGATVAGFIRPEGGAFDGGVTGLLVGAASTATAATMLRVNGGSSTGPVAFEHSNNSINTGISTLTLRNNDTGWTNLRLTSSADSSIATVGYGYTSGGGLPAGSLFLAAPTSRTITLNVNGTISNTNPPVYVNASSQTLLNTTTALGRLTVNESASTNAVGFSTNSSRMDLGTGASDYLTSDGTNVSTAAQFSATRLDATTSGAYLTPTAAFPTVAGSGHLSASTNYDLSTGSSVFAYDGQNWRNLGMGKSWGAQKKEMRVEVNIESTAAHTMRAPVLDSSAADVSWVCSDSGTPLNTVSNGRAYRRSATSATANAVAYCHTGSIAATLQTVTQTRVKPNLCAWVYTGTSATTSARHWFGLFNSFSGTVADSPTTLHVAALRFSTGASDANWMLVTCNGSSCTATSTGVAVAAATNYLLCIDVGGDDGNVRAYVNTYNSTGTVTTNSTTLPTNSNWLGFVHYMETLTTDVRTFGLSNLSLEMN